MTEFYSVFEIHASDLTKNTEISVDVTEPNGDAMIPPGAKIIRQCAFKDAIPWILVTVFERKSANVRAGSPPCA
jgi:hypothetical protein